MMLFAIQLENIIMVAESLMTGIHSVLSKYLLFLGNLYKYRL